MTSLEIGIKDWRAWAEEPAAYGDSGLVTNEATLTAIPAMMRRRLNATGKQVISCIQQLAFQNNTPAVFCSRHGELGRSIQLLAPLANGEPLSPTHFSLSVHNALAGIWSIGTGNTANISAIAAGATPVVAALTEAWTIMQAEGCDEIVCVIYDEQPPQPYTESVAATSGCNILALTLSAPSADNHVNLNLKSLNSRSEQNPSDQVEHFVRFLLASDAASLTLTTSNNVYSAERLTL